MEAIKSRKELKEEYKQQPPQMGVYQIRNTKNGKVFIGATTTLNSVWNSLRFQLDAGGYTNQGLQSEWKEFGGEAFVFEVLHEWKPVEEGPSDPRAELQTLKEMTIEECQPFGERGYHG